MAKQSALTSMTQKILNGVFQFNISKMTEIDDLKQITGLKILEMNDSIDESEQFVTDTDGNIVILDFEKITKENHRTGKCFLVYSLGENVTC
ncbi:hypothetical protein M153_1391000275, partial [Pseudoloma neurophilia]